MGMRVVVAGILERDGQLLICQRGRGEYFEYKWEFPGGKLKEEESPAEALARELAEELGIEATVGAELRRLRYQYAGREEFELIFFRVDSFRGEPANRIFEEIRWVRPEELPAYDFLAADTGLIADLARSARP